MPPLLLVSEPVRTRSLTTGVARSLVMANLARRKRAAVLLSQLIEDDRLVLGSRRARLGGEAEDLEPAVWRATTGAPARVRGRAVHHVLALPTVRTFYSHASPRTLLNRNVRPFLAGYSALGLQARYFGRDTIALDRRLGMVLGYDVFPDGVVLIEAFVGLDVPTAIRREGELESAALAELLPEARAVDAWLPRFERAFASKVGAVLEAVPEASGELVPPPSRQLAAGPKEGRVAVPIGEVTAHVAGSRVWLGGDLLTSSYLLDEVEILMTRALREGRTPDEAALLPLAETALDGARPNDLLQAVRIAIAGGG